MSWPTPYDPQRISLHVEGRISGADASRQERTVKAILERLKRQPGLILADEVGMGKTFVALAVAAFVAWNDRHRRPVVVMVPPSLKDKWPRDFETFRERCLLSDADRGLRHEFAATGLDFFRLLDNPASRRAQIIFLPHGALHRALTDPWTKLAILRKALRAHTLAAQRDQLPRFAADILRCSSKYRDERLFQQLLSHPERSWRTIIGRFDVEPEDDPVPRAILQVLKRGRVDLSALRESFKDLPLRHSKNIENRLKQVRQSLNEAIRRIWSEALIAARFHSPLLILDEAHHLKNPATRLSSLFVEKDGDEDVNILQGALSGGFERMLFLTATPFELGHSELLSVMERFRAIDWRPGSPTLTIEKFDDERSHLALSLDEAFFATHQLDQRWSSLRREHLSDSDGGDADLETWWSQVVRKPEEEPEAVQAAIRAHKRAATAMKVAEDRLRPSIIRHTRPASLPDSSIPRRKIHRGAAILDPAREHGGLAIEDEALLPFLLAARTQAVVAGRARSNSDARVQRATFAEGLASSYEAFLRTRAARMRLEQEAQPECDEDVDSAALLSAGDHGTVAWYLGQLHDAIPNESSYAEHPKIAATIRRACDLWEQGEKTLIFCHWRATSNALARHLSEELGHRINRLTATRLGCTEVDAPRHLERIGDRFEAGRPLYRHLHDAVHELTLEHPMLADEDVETIVDVVRRFVRTPAFLVRFFPMERADSNQAFIDALQRSDSSGLALRDKLRSFIEFLARRCERELRNEYLAALGEIQTGLRSAGRIGTDREDEGHRLQPSVRRATGADANEQRRRALLGFNTPFFPEILVASSVLAEGVDLHLDCRHVIHHDLGWNPSSLEQRTGRVDRIGSKAERVGQSIHVFMPYVAETQDEKMYRVVRDRERWFQVLMGTDYVLDESVTDRLSERLPLPEAAASELAFRLDAIEE